MLGFDQAKPLEGINLIVEDSTVQFFKTNITYLYRNYFKQKNNESIKSTFIVLTDACYKELDFLEQKYCIMSDDLKGNYYIADVKHFQDRGQAENFLEHIEYPGSKLYERINEIYIEPIEFNDIKATLQDQDINLFGLKVANN